MTSGVNSGELETMNVLVVGNNPTEIKDIYFQIRKLKNPLFRIAIAFNLRRIFKRIRRFRPASILIDDRMNRKRMNRLIKRLHRNPKTREIPVTLLKSDNQEFRIDAEIDNYVLKENLTSENLRKTILNSRRIRRTNIYLYKSYKRSRHLLQKIWLDLRRYRL